jgi:homoserine O-acetyltransferase/O-succinyltransferase
MNSSLFHAGLFKTESGGNVPSLGLAYCTLGEWIPGKSKVAWICHALTANADCADWWPELVGEGKAISPDEYFIVCMNIPSSCYGSSGPLSVNPQTGQPYYHEFPVFTIRDIVRASILLREHLGIEKIDLLAGGSMGGYQCIEWALMEPERIANLLLVATGARESAWGIAIHTAQRLAIETDSTFGEKTLTAGEKGLKTARAIGMLTYRNYAAFVKTQTDEDERVSGFRAESYIHYQGEKLVKRFNAYSYWLLTRTMDSHNIFRGRGEMANANAANAVLKQVKAKTLVIGISSDILCPVAEQKFLAEHIPNAKYEEIESPFGHDGFLVEGKKIGDLLHAFL